MGKYFDDKNVLIGGKPIPFSVRTIRDRYRMYVPVSFSEDKTLVSNYTYLFSKDKSPLSIAIKYSGAKTLTDRKRQIEHYFDQAIDTLEYLSSEESGVYYRETVTGSKMLSVYSLRFAAEVEHGILFGCFNCSADYREDWRDVILEMLLNIEELNSTKAD